MIHILLNIRRPLFVLDTETTGTDPAKDRIVEIGFQKWEPISDAARAAGHGGMTKEWRSLVNPGIPIPEAATAVHGITNSKVNGCRTCGGQRYDEIVGMSVCKCSEDTRGEFKPWPHFRQLAANLAIGFRDCDYAGQNVRFDLRILAAEMQRAGQAWSYAGARIVDSGRLEALAVPRTLSDLHEKYVTKSCDKCEGLGYTIFDSAVGLERCPPCKGTGQIGLPHDGAHGALSDVRAAATVIVKQLEAHVNCKVLPRDLDALHAAQWPGWLTDGGEFKVVNGVATCQFGKHRGKAMRDVPLDYYDWLLRSDFPADVKALAAEAKLGRFPEVK